MHVIVRVVDHAGYLGGGDAVCWFSSLPSSIVCHLHFVMFFLMHGDAN